MKDLPSGMTLRLVYDIPDDVWLAAAHRSRYMKAAIEDVGVARYTAWMNLARKHRPDLVEAMRLELVLTREQALLPRCGHEGCGRAVKARGLCKRHYEIWLATARVEDKVRRAEYPQDDQIVAWFEVDFNMTKVARRIGVARETLRDYIEHRPSLSARVAPLRRIPPEVVEQRLRAAQQNWKMNNPDVVREIRRRWARNQDPSARRRWNTYNRLRRANQRTALTAEDIVKAVDYQLILRGDSCVYCGGPSGTVDHIRPINSAGADVWENFAAACRSCNSQKNDRELLHYLLWRLENVPLGSGGGEANPVDPVGR